MPTTVWLGRSRFTWPGHETSTRAGRDCSSLTNLVIQIKSNQPPFSLGSWKPSGTCMITAQSTLHNSSRPRLMTFAPFPLAGMPLQKALTRHPLCHSVAFPQYIFFTWLTSQRWRRTCSKEAQWSSHSTSPMLLELWLSSFNYGLPIMAPTGICLDWKSTTRHVPNIPQLLHPRPWLISITWDSTSLIGECLFLPLWACLQCISIPPALSHMCPLGLTVSAVLWLFFDAADCGYHASFLLTEPTSSRTDSVSENWNEGVCCAMKHKNLELLLFFISHTNPEFQWRADPTSPQ